MRTIVIGDIHGAYKALLQLIECVAPQPDDLLIFLGDYVDGWSESFETVDYMITLSRKRNKNNHRAPIFLKGNHEDLFLHYLNSEEVNPGWEMHGGAATMDSYADRTVEEIAAHKEFLTAQLKDYYELNGNGYFHAGFHNPSGPQYEHYHTMPYWDRSLWEMALCIDPALTAADKRYPKRLSLYNEIFIGHTPTTRYGYFKPMQAANIWNVDTGAAFKGSITALCVESKEIWQSDPAHTFYPNEKGRN